jgi:hypothetical protein
VVRENAFNELGAGRRDGCKHEALIFALLFAFHQTTLLQVGNNQSEIAAAGKNTARQVAQALRPDVMKRLQHSELAERESLFLQANARIGKCRTRSPLQFDVSAQRTLLCGRAFEFVGHELGNLPQSTLRAQRQKFSRE